MGFTKKQRMFIENYLQCWNATEAALQAGYSERSAGSIGSENLQKPEISEEIQRRIDEACMSADEVLTSLAEIGRASIEDIMKVDDGGHLSFDFKKAMEQNKLHLIKTITPNAHGIKVELHDRMRALELIGKHHGLFTDKVDVTTDGEPITDVIRIVVKDNGEGV